MFDDEYAIAVAGHMQATLDHKLHRLVLPISKQAIDTLREEMDEIGNEYNVYETLGAKRTFVAVYRGCGRTRKVWTWEAEQNIRIDFFCQEHRPRQLVPPPGR